jgi:hypothetical protein
MNEMNEMSHRIGGVISDVGEMLSLPSSVEWPPFLFHYIIACVCVLYIICVCVLKFKYLFWYNQPITFQFTLRRFMHSGDGRTSTSTSTGTGTSTSIMNRLSLGERRNTLAIVYPFLHFVDHKSVIVYGGGDGSGERSKSITDAPYERIATFLSRREIVMPGRRHCLPNKGDDVYIPSDKFEYILSQETHGLSVFIGVLVGNTNGDIKGVSVLTPRIMLSFSGTHMGDQHQAVSIYVCDHLAWYITSERESLELLETTEYIQKCREIAGEQTLYRYHEIPGFVIPFTTVYTYTFSGIVTPRPFITTSLGDGMTLLAVSSANFALFYTFVNECTRDFRYCIFNELTQLQSLIQGGIYMIYILVLNQVRAVAAYVFESSWMKVRPMTRWYMKEKPKPKKTRGNRITALHDHISQTSTAVVKYLPPVRVPTYDAFGKRINTNTNTNTNTRDNERREGSSSGADILLLKSSIRHKALCSNDLFVRGFIAATTAMASSLHRDRDRDSLSTDMIVCIDTIAHNYHIIDTLMTATKASNFISQEKWYYILYNAIIHQEVLCKDILLI